MKAILLGALLALAPFFFTVYAEDRIGEVTDYQVVERGLHHRVWQRMTTSTNDEGFVYTKTNAYTEVSTGLHYADESGQLHEADPGFEVHPDGAIGVRTQHKTICAANVNDPDGTLDVLMVDNKRFRSRILGLSYWCPVTGDSVLIAELQDSVGVIQPNGTEIIYENAFSDIDAAVRFRNFDSGVEQDLILLAEPPSPADYGLDPATTRLQLLTEILESPQPEKTTVNRDGVNDDVALNFGAMRMAVGKGFMAVNQSDSIRVEKQWSELEPGRLFLIEQVKWDEIEPFLNDLPQAQAAVRKGDKVRHVVSNKRLLPERKVASITKTESIRVASVPSRDTGFVLDYSLLTAQANFTFASDQTYLITNLVNLTGLTIFEGGSVIKFTNNAVAKIALGTNEFRSSEYRPVVFTSMHDSTVGEAITGSTGNPWTNYCGQTALYFAVVNTPSSQIHQVKHARFSHLNIALDNADGWEEITVRDTQFVHCQTAFQMAGPAVKVYNGLFYDVGTVFTGGRAVAQHITVNRCNTFATDGSPFLEPLSITNSLFICVTNLGSYTTVESNSLVRLSSDAGIFETVGAGAHYLSATSSYRDAGTTNIETQLRTDLTNRTTYPPVVFAGDTSSYMMTNTAEFRPVASRDTGVPDIGYHYAPIDFAFGFVQVTNCTLSAREGTVLAAFNPSTTTRRFGIRMNRAATMNFEGSPLSPVRIVRYNTVQEQANTNWAGVFSPSIDTAPTDPPSSVTLSFKFCDWSVMANDAPHVEGGRGANPALKFKDCQFHGGELASYRLSLNVTNCLFERSKVTVDSGSYTDTALQFHQNLFWRNTVTLSNRATANVWSFTNNLFYRSTIPLSGSIGGNRNGFITGSNTLSSGANNTTVSDVAFESGTLGRFYQATSSGMIGVGSATASSLGFHHYTTATNQTKDSGTVDIGFHYVALASGVPNDADSDGLADYIEDANGNGTWNSATETDWGDADSDNDGVSDYFEWLQGSSGTISNPITTDLQFRVNTPLK
jgi:hypothetical protein